MADAVLAGKQGVQILSSPAATELKSDDVDDIVEHTEKETTEQAE